MKWGPSLFLVILLSAPTVLAESDRRILGQWGSVRVVGLECQRDIEKIHYFFGADGSYEIEARMRRVGGTRTEKARGTYRLIAGEISGYVEGATVGPFAYRLEQKLLVLTQRNPWCEIYLSRDEE